MNEPTGMPSRLVVYNSLSNQKERFSPLDSSCVRMYVCGPTVYNRIHLGNARCCVIFDVIYRVLQELFPRVVYVMNVTDVDDKINAEAQKQGISIKELTQKTIAQFHQDISLLGVLPPSIEPRATDHINEMITIIQSLIERGHAYVADKHVLFDVRSFEGYGKLSRMPLEHIRQGSRIEVAPYKKNPEDFVLWKPSSDKEPAWPSPFGRGRPGWHIECSAMSMRYLGNAFDIHGGGQDLIFPHHENERAQSCALNNLQEFVHYWVHSGMLIVGGQKMSKSLGNFILLSDVLSTHRGEIVRWALMTAHYRHMLDWTPTLLQQATSCVDSLYQSLSPFESLISSSKREIDADLMDALCDDFNLPEALTCLQRLANALNKTSSRDEALRLASKLRHSAQLLGLCQIPCSEWFQTLPSGSILSRERIRDLIDQRNRARESKNFALADSLRKELKAQGVILEDRSDGSTSWKITALSSKD